MIWIFDLDGTLVDSMASWIGKMRNVLAQYNVREPEEFVKTITPLGDRGCALYFQELGVPLSVEEMIRMMHEYSVKKYTYEIQAKETVPETIRALRDRGETLAVLTASPHPMLDPCLKRLGLYDLFQEVWSCDDFGTSKSDPDIYRRAAALLGAEPAECNFVDDNLIALKTARSAGMHVIGAYDSFSDPYLEEIREVCEKFVVRMEEILS